MDNDRPILRRCCWMPLWIMSDRERNGPCNDVPEASSYSLQWLLPLFQKAPSSSGIRKRHGLSTRATKQTEDIEVTRYLPRLRRFICKSCDEQWLAKTVNRLNSKKPQNDFDLLCLLPLTQRNQLLICKTSIGFLHHDIHGSTRALWSSAYCGEAVQTHMASHTVLAIYPEKCAFQTRSVNGISTRWNSNIRIFDIES